MSARIVEVSRAEMRQLIFSEFYSSINEDGLRAFERFIMTSSTLWVGYHEGKLLCTWGIVPPTLVSNSAYLWLHVTEAVKDHEFLFVRQSQRAIEGLLRTYNEIQGHVLVGNSRAVRWLRWLGASFGDHDGKLIPFTIRAKHG